jgi:single-strand DNA-binding protein
LNKATLIGNLTRDPVLKKTANGSTVCTYGIATNSVWKDSQNNVQERTEFHNIVAWNKLGEICAQLLSVGMFIYIEGELRTRTWEDDNGVRHYRTEVKAQDMKILDKKGKEGVGVEEAMQDSDSNKNTADSEDDSDSGFTYEKDDSDGDDQAEDDTKKKDNSAGDELF